MEKIYYVCKYTPVELIEDFGLEAARMDPSPSVFSCADNCLHPNLCGYGKAVLEEVEEKQIRRLILVDCCDVCRRLYDVLRAQGKMEFLFLLSLPHKYGPTAEALFSKELSRLETELSMLTGLTLDTELLVTLWKRNSAELPAAENAVHVTGAHGGGLLLHEIRERLPFAVIDDTCTGNRRLSSPESEWNVQTYASAVLRQPTPCMRMQEQGSELAQNSIGEICHTVKFCDYYSFQYLHRRNEVNVPLLKIETDCTPQSSGQIHTRIDAFGEILQANSKHMKGKIMAEKYVAGIDSGSASTDAVILDRSGTIVGSAILPTGAGAAASAQSALSAAAQSAGIDVREIGRIISTGYGRETIGIGDSFITEITCHAKGAHHLAPEARTIIDIGGQDSKVIILDEDGNVQNFIMNDKCAAGTGRFLEMMARTLQLSLEEMSQLGLRFKNDVQISSMCTVFAESEVVSLIAGNTAAEDIIHGLNQAVAVKTAGLVKRANGRPAFVMTGGVARNPGVVAALEEKLNASILVPEQAQLCGALGAALFALE